MSKAKSLGLSEVESLGMGEVESLGMSEVESLGMSGGNEPRRGESGAHGVHAAGWTCPLM